MTPHRIQLRRTKGWRKPDNTVVVARPTKWGNPFTIGGYPSAVRDFNDEWIRVSESARRRFSVNDFEQSLRSALHPDEVWSSPISIEFRIIAESLEELRGKNLACWCPLDQPCHADVLLDLANRSAS